MKRTTLISLALVAVIIGGWYLTLGKPIKARIADLTKKVAAEDKKLAAYRDALAQFNDRIDEYNGMQTEPKSKAVIFSGRDEVVTLYHDLDSLCHQPGYRLDEITPSVDEVISFLREWERSDSTINIPIRIRIDADYRSLASLIEALEKSKYFERLSTCRLRGSENLFPRCDVDVTFIAGLSNRLEMFDLE
jgi:hypothetical protein